MEVTQITLVVAALCCGCLHAISINRNVQYDDNKFNTKGWNIHITLHVYSGREDPTWLIADSHPAYTFILSNAGISTAHPLPSKLGYKGFSLVHIPPGGSSANAGHQNWTITLNPDLEMFLLHSSNTIQDDLIQHVRASILQPLTQRKRRSLYDNYNYNKLFDVNPSTTVDPIMSLPVDEMYELAKLWGLDKKFRNITTTPPPIGKTKYEPSKWNTHFVKFHNNCYNYANNKITDTFAQPGRAGRCDFPTETPQHGGIIEKLAMCDHLQAVPAPDQQILPKHDWNLVALVFWPPQPGSDMYDFHWYRLDGNGRWSHKPGQTEVVDHDNSGHHIMDPRHADRGHYTEFVGFMQTRQDKVIIF